MALTLAFYSRISDVNGVCRIYPLFATFSICIRYLSYIWKCL